MLYAAVREEVGCLKGRSWVLERKGGTNSIESDNVRLFRRIINRGFCQGDLSVADEICATKLSEHEYLAKTDIPGPEILKDQIRDARSSIRDLVLTVEDMVESGGAVWARSRATGSDPRSGKPVSI